MTDVDTLIQNGTILTMNPQNETLTNGAVAIKGEHIIDVGPTTKLNDKYEARKVIDASNSVVMPGLIDTYAHAGHSMIKGIWNPFRGWPSSDIYFNASTPEFWHADGLLAALDRLKFGTTCGVSIIGATPARLDDPAFAENNAKAVEEVGIRSFIGVGPPDPFIPGQNRLRSVIWKGLTSHDHTYTYDETIENAIHVIKRWHKQADGRIHVCLSFPYLFGRLPSHSKIGAMYKYLEKDIPVLLEKAQEMRQLANEHGVQIHSHVYGEAIEFGMAKFGKDKVYELLGSDVVLAHCNSLTNQEIAILSETDTKVATAPSAGEPFRFGRCPVPELIEAGVCVATSTDGAAPYMTYDMFVSIRIEMTIQKYHFQDPSYLPAGKMLRMVTIDAARVLGMDSQLGSIEPNKRADIILLDMYKAHLTPPTFLPLLLVYYGSGHDVKTVLVDGNILMENREVLTVNEAQVIENARAEIENAFTRFEKLGYSLEPYIEMDHNYWYGFKQYEFPMNKD